MLYKNLVHLKRMLIAVTIAMSWERLFPEALTSNENAIGFNTILQEAHGCDHSLSLWVFDCHPLLLLHCTLPRVGQPIKRSFRKYRPIKTRASHPYSMVRR